MSNVNSGSVQRSRIIARAALVFMAALMVVLVGLMGASSGPNGALVLAQETASPTPDPTAPTIHLLNPNGTYDPVIVNPMEPAEDPKISDRFDGTDGEYHVVAVTRRAPANAVVEAYWVPEDENELTVGQLTLVPGSQDTWEFFWDVPSDFDEGSGEFKVRLFRPSGGSFVQAAEDVVAAELRHEGSFTEGDDAPADNTVEMLWPANNGRLGFHKPRGGVWRTWINGTSSGEIGPGGQVTDSAIRVRLFYSITPIGEAIEFVDCGEADPANRKTDGSETWGGTCTLGSSATPSEVTAVAAVATGFDRPGTSGAIAETSMESADAHRVQPYVQDVRDMTVAIKGVPSGTSATYPTGKRRTADSDCLEFDVTVIDVLERPVQGANVDIHLEGPNDQVGYGDEAAAAHGSSAEKAPDKGSHQNESQWDCDAPGDRYTDQQGDHNIPGAPDLKHIESETGTGVSGPTGIGPGQFRFHIFSTNPGFSDITAWVDDEPLTDESEPREADDDLPGADEAKGSLRAQWFPAAMTATITPEADSATVGECNRFVLRVRAGSAVVPAINADIHASGPNNDLDFCDPEGATPRRAPDLPEGDGSHRPEDEGEAAHESASPDDPEVQHTEGETDQNGNFVFGLRSAATGSTTIEAWVDGEAGEDNDVRDSGEVSSTAGTSWVGSAQDAEVRFVNPSGYGGAGDNLSIKRDANEMVHLVARVDLPDVVAGVEFHYSEDGETFVPLGGGSRIGTSDTWELLTGTIPEGDLTLRAQITNTTKVEDREVTVDNTLETAELTAPGNALGTSFSEGATTIRGVASAGAEGVELYYTKTEARETRESAQWILCGESELPTGDSPQNFEGDCTLEEGDSPVQVTGIAALAWVCDPVIGCEIERTYQTGDAHRTFGFESNPSVTIQPADASGRPGTCQRFEMTVTDSAERAIPGANVDVHFTGPTDAASFCNLGDGSPRRSPSSAGGHVASSNDGEAAVHSNEGPDTHHTEGETNEGGKFIFGVRSGSAGESEILGWADQNDSDVLDEGERSDRSTMRWTGGGGGGGGAKGCTIRGDSGDNVLRGTSGDDVICAGGGKDVIRGGGGDDTIYGGGGNDDIRGNSGNDRMIGGGGIDVMRGGRGNDVARGNKGTDTLRGFTGKDRLSGGPGRDVLAGGNQNDVLKGNRGNDTLNGGPDRDRCNGGPGRDSKANCEA